MGITEIKTENYNIIGNGSVFTFKSEPLKIKINTGVSAEDLSFEIIFLDNPEKNNSIDFEIINENKPQSFLKIKIFNVKSFGSTVEPLSVAEENGKKIYLSLSFNKHSDSFLCSYTFFIKN
jgi:hypothetical protein